MHWKCEGCGIWRVGSAQLFATNSVVPLLIQLGHRATKLLFFNWVARNAAQLLIQSHIAPCVLDYLVSPTTCWWYSGFLNRLEHVLYAGRMSLNCLETVKKRWGSMDLEGKVRVKFIHHLNVLVESCLRWMNSRLSDLGHRLLSSIHLITYEYSSLTEFLSSSFHILHHHHLLHPQPSSFSSTSRCHLQRFVTRAIVDCPLIFHFKPAAPTDEEWD